MIYDKTRCNAVERLIWDYHAVPWNEPIRTPKLNRDKLIKLKKAIDEELYKEQDNA